MEKLDWSRRAVILAVLAASKISSPPINALGSEQELPAADCPHVKRPAQTILHMKNSNCFDTRKANRCSFLFSLKEGHICPPCKLFVSSVLLTIPLSCIIMLSDPIGMVRRHSATAVWSRTSSPHFRTLGKQAAPQGKRWLRWPVYVCRRTAVKKGRILADGLDVDSAKSMRPHS